MSVTEPTPAQQPSSTSPVSQASYQAVPFQAGPAGTQTAAGKQILLTVVTFGIMAYVWTYRQHNELQRFSGEGVGGGLGIVLCMFGITPFILSSEVQKAYERTGRPAPISAATGCLVFVPFIGAILWYTKCQRAINELWAAQGA